jgi:glycosyltransferase involved in cell wall biosynthesis
MPSISYAITACNEHVELDRLLTQLTESIRPEDEIVIQLDKTATVEVRSTCFDFGRPNLRVAEFPLNGDFASFKNNLIKECLKDYIFQIDADEYLSEELLLLLPEILELNPEIELYAVPRINTVEGLTQEHIQKWGWKLDENGWVNYPDYQARVCKNIPQFKWVGKVHEKILGDDGFNANVSFLPTGYDLELIHPKTIERQERQNNYYDTI